jgi:CheY-like chemotaxis protein
MTNGTINPTSETASADQKSLLVVDDNVINRRLIQATLVRLGYKVDAASDGADAVVKFTNNFYNAILMDIMMPVMDGIEATIAIRKIEDERNIPPEARVKIIALTANAYEDDRSKLFESGMNHYLNKPLEVEELQKILNA